MAAPSVRATAAIMQSTNFPRRRPEALYKRAASAACSRVKSLCRPTTRVVNSSSVSLSGPHRNSAQATVDMMRGSFAPTQFRSLRSSGDPGCKARMRKLVSRWIMALPRQVAAPPRTARSAPPAPKPQGQLYASAEKPVSGREHREPSHGLFPLPAPQSEGRGVTLRIPIPSSVVSRPPGYARTRHPRNMIFRFLWSFEYLLLITPGSKPAPYSIRGPPCVRAPGFVTMRSVICPSACTITMTRLQRSTRSRIG